VACTCCGLIDSSVARRCSSGWGMGLGGWNGRV